MQPLPSHSSAPAPGGASAPSPARSLDRPDAAFRRLLLALDPGDSRAAVSLLTFQAAQAAANVQAILWIDSGASDSPSVRLHDAFGGFRELAGLEDQAASLAECAMSAPETRGAPPPARLAALWPAGEAGAPAWFAWTTLEPLSSSSRPDLITWWWKEKPSSDEIENCRALTIVLRIIEALKRARAQAGWQALIPRTLGAAAREALIGLDASGRIQFWNPAAERLYGWSEDQILGHSFTRLFPSNGGSISAAASFEASSAGGSKRGVAQVHAGGEEFFANLSLLSARDPLSGLPFYAASAREDSQDDPWRRNARFFLHCMKHIAEGLAVFDLEGALVFLNPAMEKMLGVQSLEDARRLAPDQWRLALGDTGTSWEAIRAGVLQNGGWSAECRSTLIPGPARDLSIRASLIRDEDSRPWAVSMLVEDVTSRREAERFRAAFERKLCEAHQLNLLSSAAGKIANDFNNLLGVIQGNLELMNLSQGAARDRQPRLEAMTQAVARAADLCDRLMAYSKGRGVIQPLDLRELANRAIAERKAQSFSQIQWAIGDLPHTDPARGDAAQMDQALKRLLDNAAEALDGRQGRVEISTGVMQAHEFQFWEMLFDQTTPASEDFLFIEVADSAGAWDGEKTRRIAEPFFTTKSKGLGLGFAAIFAALTAHQGALAVLWTPGGRTAFRLILPKASAPGTHPETPREPAAPAPPTGGRILIVDDEAAVAGIAAAILDSAGFQPLVALNGQDGLQLFQIHCESLDCVILDIVMPDISGLDLLKLIQAAREDLPVILSSGYSERDIAPRLGGADAPPFLKKPFGANDLLKIVYSVMRPSSKTFPRLPGNCSS